MTLPDNLFDLAAPPSRHVTVTDPSVLAAALDRRPRTEIVALDTETHGLHAYLSDRVLVGSLSFDGEVYVFPKEVAAPIIEAAYKGLVVFHNANFDRAMIARSFGLEINDANVIDTLTIDWCLRESWPHALKEIAARLWGHDEKSEQIKLNALLRGATLEEAYKMRRGEVGRSEPAAVSKEWARAYVADHPRKTYADLTLEEWGPYAAKDAELTWRLLNHHNDELRALDGTPRDVRPALLREHAVDAFCYRLTRTGVKVSTDRAEVFAAEAERHLAEIAADPVFEGINIGSSPQLATLVYDKWDFECTRFTETGARSVDKRALDPFAWHEGVAKAREYKKVSKALSAFYRPILEHCSDDGRVHPSFRGHGTETGRFSCVAADSLIEMPRNLSKYPDGVPITEVRAGDWIYSFDWQRDLVLRKVKWVAQTGVKQTVIITVENSEGHRLVLRATPEHLIRLRNGDWRAAGSLIHKWGAPRRSDGNRVMTMVRRNVDDGYIKFFPHSVARQNGVRGGGKYREHRWVLWQITGRRLSSKTDVHHLDGNRANNHPSNLQALTIAEHRGRRHIHHHWGQGGEPMDLYSGPTDYFVVSVDAGPVEPVWDMEVEDTHAFIANGICVHNCSAPNCQQLPRGRTNRRVRPLFVAEQGMELVEFDLDQAELRIGACISGERSIIETLERDGDVYQEVAAAIGRDRQTAKMVVLSSNYGIGAKKLADQLAVGTGERPDPFRARAMLDAYWRKYPRLKRALEEHARRWETLRYLPLGERWPGRLRHIDGPFGEEKSYAAFNAVVQGGQAEFLKDVLLDLEGAITDVGRIVLTIHDSVVLELDAGDANKRWVGTVLRTITNDRNPWDVPLRWSRRDWAPAPCWLAAPGMWSWLCQLPFGHRGECDFVPYLDE